MVKNDPFDWNNKEINDTGGNDINKHHSDLYDSLADKYIFNAKNTKRQYDNYSKAVFLKKISVWNSLLEVGIWAWIMNKMLSNVGFKTHWIDISIEMVKSAKLLQPHATFEHGDFLDLAFGERQFDCIVEQAFIHLFPTIKAHEIMLKNKNLLKKNWILHLTTTKENKYEEWFFNKSDYNKTWVMRYRAKHTRESFISLLTNVWMKIADYKEERSEDGKIWMAITGRK